MAAKTKQAPKKQPFWKHLPWLTIGVTLTYAGFFTWLFWDRFSSFFTAPKVELNQIGDFLAGMFAPLAVLWLVVAVLVQKQELAETKQQFDKSQRQIRRGVRRSKRATDKQVRLAYETAQANYSFSLFEKRVSVYNRLIHTSRNMKRDGTPDWDAQKVIFNAVNECELIFGSEIMVYMKAIEKILLDVMDGQYNVDIMRKPSPNNPWTQAENDTFNQFAKKRDERIQKLYSQITYKNITDLFVPHLKLPNKIDLPKSNREKPFDSEL